MIKTLLLTLAPITIAIIVGFVLVRLRRPFDNATLGPIASDVAMPCLIFATLAQADMSTADFARTALAALIALLAFACLGAVVLKIAGMRLRTYLPSVTWGNAGFLGMPLAFYAFGQPGLIFAAAFSAVSLLFNSIFAQFVGLGRVNLSVVLRTPLVYAVVGGALVATFHTVLPGWFLKSVSLIGGLAIPLVLMMIGASLARIKPVVIGRALTFSVARILGGAGIALLVAIGIGLTGTARNVLILQCAMPVAALSYVFAQKCNNDPDEIASIVAVSTWASVISIPVMLGLMMGPAFGPLDANSLQTLSIRAGTTAEAASPLRGAEITSKEQPSATAQSGALLARGDTFYASGDVTSARLFFEYAAAAGNSTAALRLGNTFDSAFLIGARVGRVQGDPAVASQWYRRARTLGNSDAELLLRKMEAIAR